MANLGLPIDIISEILSRLPAKVLLRSKSVCKTWRDLIENPNFIDKHEKTRSGITSILVITQNEMYLEDEGFYKLIDFNFNSLISDDGGVHFRLLGICKGLVCVKLNNLDYIIGNPTTREFRRISSSNLSDMEEGGLVFYGFTFFSNEFMLVKLIYRNNISTIGEVVVVKAEVYTMSTDTWVELEIDVEKVHVNNVVRLCRYGPCIGTLPVVRNGVFYWEATSSKDGRVLTFNVSDKIVDEINIPTSVINGEEQFWRIIEFEEKISLVFCTSEHNFELWALNGNGDGDDSWTRRLRIDTFSIFEIDMGDFMAVVDYTRNGELVMFRDCYWYSEAMHLYDLSSRETKDFPYIYVEGGCFYFYTESLHSV